MGLIPGFPLGHVTVQRGQITDNPNVTLHFQRPIVGKLPISHTIGLGRRGVVNMRRRATGRACDQGGNAQRDPPCPHFWECHGALGTPFAGRALFLGANRVGGK